MIGREASQALLSRQTMVLKSWFFSHIRHPYPSEAEHGFFSQMFRSNHKSELPVEPVTGSEGQMSLLVEIFLMAHVRL